MIVLSEVILLSEDRAFEAVKKKIYDTRGLDTRQYKDSYIKRRLATRMRATGVESYGEYLGVLNRNAEEFNPLLNALTINVTEFFRNPETYEAIEDVLKELILEKEKKGRNLIRIWSAGCSSGEEPYSIAILLSEILKDRLNDFNISIHATDVDNAILERAKAGEYKIETFKNIKKLYLTKYFTREEDSYIVKNDVKRFIKFKRHDLISEKKLGLFDAVLCRNVVIYFSKDLQERLYMHFYNSLVAGGYFIMGKTETLLGEAQSKFKPVNKSERIYQKPM